MSTSVVPARQLRRAEVWAASLAGLGEHRLPSMRGLDHAIPMIATEDIGRAAATLN